MPRQIHTPIIKIECHYLYDGQSIPYSLWSTSNGKTIDRIIFLGTVQIEKLAEWVAESCPSNTVIVQGAPHWFAKSDGSDISEFMLGFTQSVFSEITSRYPIDKVHVIAESQGAAGAIELFARDKYYVHLDKLTLIQPLGLNRGAYSGHDSHRISTFKRRVAANALRQLPSLTVDRRLRYNHRLMGKMVKLRSAKARAQYTSGLEYNAVPSLKNIYARNKNITVICGAKDKLFPPIEISNTLAAHKINVKMEIVKGVPHSPLATKMGLKLLGRSLKAH